MSYPIEYSRGLATAYLQELEKRGQRIISQIKSVPEMKKGSTKERQRVTERFERILSRMPTYRYGRGHRIRLFACIMERSYRNPVKDWEEHGFWIGKCDILSGLEPNLSVIVSRHAIERIFERASEHCVDEKGAPNIFAMYDFFRELPLWSELFFNFKIFVLNSMALPEINQQSVAAADEEFLNMSFCVPARSGMFFCQVFRDHLFVRTFIDESLFDNFQKEVFIKLSGIPPSFKTNRLVFYREIGGMFGTDTQSRSDRIRIHFVSQYLCQLVEAYPTVFFRAGESGRPSRMVSRISKMAHDNLSLGEVEEIFRVTGDLDDVGFKRSTNKLLRISRNI